MKKKKILEKEYNLDKYKCFLSSPSSHNYKINQCSENWLKGNSKIVVGEVTCTGDVRVGKICPLGGRV